MIKITIDTEKIIVYYLNSKETGKLPQESDTIPFERNYIDLVVGEIRVNLQKTTKTEFTLYNYEVVSYRSDNKQLEIITKYKNKEDKK